MSISSRTPEGVPSHCAICGTRLELELSDPPGDAPCPRCGCLVWEDGEVVFRLPGPMLSLESFNAALENLSRWIETREKTRLNLDFQDVSYVASAALGKMINLKKMLQTHKGTVRLTNLHPDLLEIFRITRLDQIFRLD